MSFHVLINYWSQEGVASQPQLHLGGIRWCETDSRFYYTPLVPKFIAKSLHIFDCPAAGLLASYVVVDTILSGRQDATTRVGVSHIDVAELPSLQAAIPNGLLQSAR